MRSSTAAPAAMIAGSRPFVRTRDDAPAYRVEDILRLILASGEDTGGRWSTLEELCPKGSGAPPHRHLWPDETFYVVEGEVRFFVDDQIQRVTSGAFVVVPRGTVHGYRVGGDQARILNQYTPASRETAVIALAEPAGSRTLPPPKRSAPNPTLALDPMKIFGMEPAPEPDPLRVGFPVPGTDDA